MIKQRWAKQPPTEPKADRVLLYRTGTKLGPYWQHGFQYLDKFDVVLVRDGRHEDELVSRIGDVNNALYFEFMLMPTLRIPCFRSDMLWMREGEVTSTLLDLWRSGPQEWEFGLQYAIYHARPLIWMLPDWRRYEEEHRVYRGYDVYANRDENDWRASVWQGGAQLWASGPNAHEEADTAIAEGKLWIDGRKD